MRPQSEEARRPTLALIGLFVLLFGARILGSTIGFVEGDEAGIALGIAARLSDVAGDLYRYTVQLGYYRLVEALTLLSGGAVPTVPVIMKGLSAFAGALVPITGFFAFRHDLPVRERWLVVLTLALNPVLWTSSRYGNTATIALAISTLSLVMLSNRPGRSRQLFALVIFGLATLVRADTVLLAPLVFVLLRRNEGSWGRALLWSAASGAAMVACYAGLLVVDPEFDSAAIAVMDHMVRTPSPTMFWEFLLWASSPVPLLFAVWGMRDLSRTNPRLVGLLLVWCLPTLLFYFRATTTPRYFLNVIVPLSVAAAVGMSSLATRLRTWTPAPLAWTGVVALASLHLFVALGHFRADNSAQMFRGAALGTADGFMPTGALLYSTYTSPNSFLRSLPEPRFEASGRRGDTYPVMSQVVRRLADPNAARRTVIVIMADDWPPMFHYHALAAGARYVSRPENDVWWRAAIWLELGNARVMTVGAGNHYRRLERFEVQPGDLIWLLADGPFPDSAALERMPTGLALEPTQGFDAHFRTFRVVER